MSNEQTFIESDHIARHASMSKRRPDIIATFTSTLKKYHTSQSQTEFGDWVQLVSDHRFLDLTSGKGQWLDVHQSWELDMSHKEYPVLHRESSESQDPTWPLSSNRKRQSDKALSGDRKRVRGLNPNQSSNSTPFQTVDKEKNLVPELRCAYYAIERLRSAYHVTHSMTVHLEGKCISIDFGGCCTFILCASSQTLYSPFAGTTHKDVSKAIRLIFWRKCRCLSLSS